jgi:N-methylhydantoinase A
VLRRLDGEGEIEALVGGRFTELERAGNDELAAAGHDLDGAIVERSLDMRYAGQSYEGEVAIDGEEPERWGELFHAAHAARYGHGHPGRPVEIVNARLRLRLPGSRVADSASSPGGEPAGQSSAAPFAHVEVWFGRPLPTPLYHREQLGDGCQIDGPAVIVQMDTTAVLNPGWRLGADRTGNLLLERA